MTITYIQKTTLAIPALKDTAAYAEQFEVVATKTGRLLNILLAGETITVRDAAFELDIFCLSSLVHYLRKRRHIPVQTEIIKTIHSNGRMTRYGQYFLAASDIAEINTKKVLQ